MLQIILMIIGIVIAVRRPRLKRLTPQDYPGLDPEKFTEWHNAQLSATNTFLWASWGSFVIGIILVLIVASMGGLPFEGYIAFRVFIIVGTIVWFIVAGVKSSSARKLREELGIQWPISSGKPENQCSNASIHSITSDDNLISAEDFAKQKGMSTDEVVENIREGKLAGKIDGGQWYVNLKLSMNIQK